MYLVMTIGIMVVLPIAAILVELATTQGTDLLLLVGKWFTFWGIGVRLLIAGISQSLRPGFTARGIFEIEDKKAEIIVSELGYANLSFGLLGMLSLPFPAFLMPAAIAGGVFLGLDGIRHILSAHRTRNETIAMATDLVVAAAVAVYLVGALT